MKRLLGLSFLLLGGSLWAGSRPLVTVIGTCAALGPNTYPLDAVNWFDAGKHSQVVFYSHLLFPVRPEPGEEAPALRWNPPLRLGVSATAQASAEAKDFFYAEATWSDPKGERLAQYGLTFSARARSDWLKVNGRDYIPHTFAMAVGTRDLRSDAGQVKLPSQEGQYTVRFQVDGRPVALAFFRMLRAVAPASAGGSGAAGPAAPPGPAQASPVTVPAK